MSDYEKPNPADDGQLNLWRAAGHKRQATAVAHPNIAFIKYWGNTDDRLRTFSVWTFRNGEEWGISQYRLARAMRTSPRRINEVVHGRRAITADTALRLGRFFSVSAEIWLNLQVDYELRVAQRKSGADIDKRVVPLEHAP